MKVSREQVTGNRARILEAAGRLFRERGFDGVSVAEVMRAAGLTHGGFYGYFRSKDDLVAHTLAALMSRAHRGRSGPRHVRGGLPCACAPPECDRRLRRGFAWRRGRPRHAGGEGGNDGRTSPADRGAGAHRARRDGGGAARECHRQLVSHGGRPGAGPHERRCGALRARPWRRRAPLSSGPALPAHGSRRSKAPKAPGDIRRLR